MRVALSRRADADLDDILDYSIAAHGRAVAEAYLQTINATFDKLTAFPELGIARSDLIPDLRSLPIGEHRIFYVILGDIISIVRILHKAMDPARHV